MTPSSGALGAARAWDLVRAVAHHAAPSPSLRPVDPTTAAGLPRPVEVEYADAPAVEGPRTAGGIPGAGGMTSARVLLAHWGGGTVTVWPDGSWRSDAPVDVEAAGLFDVYLPIAVPDALVIGQIGQSLDGRVATETGHSHYVTGPEDLDRLHRVRALVDAVVVGAGTALADDPRLTVRRVVGTHPARVVIDPSGRLPPTLSLFSDGEAPTLWLRHAEPEESPRPGARVVLLPPSGGRMVAPQALVALLRTLGLRRILVEGGGITVSAFLASGALDRLHVTIAPVVIGSGRQGLTLPAVDRLEDALRPACRTFPLGQDVLFDLDLRGRVPERSP